MSTLRFSSSYDASLFEQVLRDRHIAYDRPNAVSIHLEQDIDEWEIERLEDAAHVRVIGRRE